MPIGHKDGFVVIRPQYVPGGHIYGLTSSLEQKYPNLQTEHSSLDLAATSNVK